MTKEYSWMLGPFEKAAEANPCLVPNAVSRFFCPVQEKELGWEAKDVFNPAAVVKDDRVYLLYRQKIMRENMPELPVSEWLSVKTDCIFRRCRSLSCILKKTNFPSMNGKEDVKIPGL
ncbi:MAG: hypothetical protein ACLURV_10630 [Gallintestinimicrobium sp.]